MTTVTKEALTWELRPRSEIPEPRQTGQRTGMAAVLKTLTPGGEALFVKCPPGLKLHVLQMRIGGSISRLSDRRRGYRTRADRDANGVWVWCDEEG